MLPVLKHQHNGFVQVYSQVLQQVAVRVDLAFKAFFRRLKEKAKTGEKAGFPRYKGQNRYDSITYPQFSNGCRAAEKLDVQDMQQNRRLSKSISDAAWSMFRHCLQYKAEEAGIGFKPVTPKYTSQTCSGCGIVEKKPLSQRWHECACGVSLDRDHNAAINILTLGLQRQVECMCPNDFIG